MTPLMLAARWGKDAACKALLKRKADHKLVDKVRTVATWCLPAQLLAWRRACGLLRSG